MISVTRFEVSATSLVSHDEKQRCVLTYYTDRAAHLLLSAYRHGKKVVDRVPVAFNSGSGTSYVMLPVAKESAVVLWRLTDKEGNVVAETEGKWQAPREWTLYVMISSHTDIGLHNSQYIQRANGSKFIDGAKALCDATAERAEHDRYRYTVEGTWIWNNYVQDRGEAVSADTVKRYVKNGSLGVCAGVAGNLIHTYGLEEMCRSTYERRRLSEKHGIDCETLTMIDFNGLPVSMLDPYADAGYKNIIFAPNPWGPCVSTVWRTDGEVPGYVWNPESGGSGSRIDVRYESALPMVFNWESKNGQQMTVWTSTQYQWGGSAFGLFAQKRQIWQETPEELCAVTEAKMGEQLTLLESKYPYDLWLFACYSDDQAPNGYLTDQIVYWNKKWKWPILRTLGAPDEPFRELRTRFGDRIPVLKGDITGGWYQLPLSVPDIMSQKREAHRRLPNAEKWAVAACLCDADYTYPTVSFRRAWDQLLYNDEHSYGASNYKGRSVYETWMQHRDWVEKVDNTARVEEENALRLIASHVFSKEKAIVAFNATARQRTEYVETDDGKAGALVTLPPFGYVSIKERELSPTLENKRKTKRPPIVENEYYVVRFAKNGTLASVFDKELQKELLDREEKIGANTLLYTKDGHESFLSPSDATFEIVEKKEKTEVLIQTKIKGLGAEIKQKVTVLNYCKRIDLDNELLQVRDMINGERYKRYLYIAFPFLVQNARRLCHLNGTVAEYARDVTGHGTDVYMAADDFCCVENDIFGVALFSKDYHLVEFAKIHSDKTDFGDVGEGSAIFSYVANDWLQKHVSGGKRLHYRFRYAITSYRGTYKTANVSEMAELYAEEVKTVSIESQDGDLPERQHSFLPMHTDGRFICLKRAEDGDGLIARFYGEGSPSFEVAWNVERVAVDERVWHERNACFSIYRIGSKAISLPERREADGDNMAIGAFYTGLITEPCAAAGAEEGQLYLLWGACRDKAFSHYLLYRSETSGFTPSTESLIARVMPEEYVVARYEDVGLLPNTTYYYRVCAVDRQGNFGPFSAEFCGHTREPLWKTKEE